MMGPSHAATGAAAGVLLAVAGPYSANLIGAPVGWEYVAGAGVLAAGAALVPDLDQQSSTASHALPPVTTALSGIIGPISGGHRELTHKWPGLVLWGILAFLFVQHTWTVTLPLIDRPFNVGLALLTTIVGALANKALRIAFGPVSGWLMALALGIALGFLVPVNGMWIAGALVVGYAAHIVGDMLTTEGVRFFWPTRINLRIPILGNAGSGLEPGFVSAVVAFAAMALVATAVHLPLFVIIGVSALAGVVGLATGKIVGTSKHG